MTTPLGLYKDEEQWIATALAGELEDAWKNGRCGGCGHLNIFHNQHCCIFCTVEDCSCQDGNLSTRTGESS